jgi:hypothetical protein
MFNFFAYIRDFHLLVMVIYSDGDWDGGFSHHSSLTIVAPSFTSIEKKNFNRRRVYSSRFMSCTS